MQGVNHTTSKGRRHLRWAPTRNTRTLWLVLGWLLVTLGATIAALAFMQEPHNRTPFLVLGGRIAAVGGLTLALYLLFVKLPDGWSTWRSPTWQRRIRGSRSRRLWKDGRPAGNAAAKSPPPGFELPPPPAKSGAALIFVLALTGLAAALLLEVQALARSQSQRVSAILTDGDLRRAAADAARAAIQRLADDEDLEADSLDEPWAAREVLQRPDGVVTEAVVRDEASRFDLNNLAVPPRQGDRSMQSICRDLYLFCRRGQADDFFLAAADWTDEDAEGDREDAFYGSLLPARAAPDLPFCSWPELEQVAGAPVPVLQSPAPTNLFAGLAAAAFPDLFTVVPVPRNRPLPVNLNTAGREVLLALIGLGREGTVETILALRQAAPLRGVEALQFAADPDVWQGLRPFADVRSRVFRVHAAATRADRTVRVSALLERNDRGAVRILSWVCG